MMYGLKSKRRISDDPLISATMVVWIVVCIGVAYAKPLQSLIIAWLPQFVEVSSQKQTPIGIDPASVWMQDALRRLNIAALPVFFVLFFSTDGLCTYERLKRGFKWYLFALTIILLFGFMLFFMDFFSSNEPGVGLTRLPETRPGAALCFAAASLMTAYLAGYLGYAFKRTLLQ